MRVDYEKSTSLVPEMSLTTQEETILMKARNIQERQKDFKRAAIARILESLVCSCRVHIVYPGYDGYDSVDRFVTRNDNGTICLVPNTRYGPEDVTDIESNDTMNPIITIHIGE